MLHVPWCHHVPMALSLSCSSCPLCASAVLLNLQLGVSGLPEVGTGPSATAAVANPLLQCMQSGCQTCAAGSSLPLTSFDLVAVPEAPGAASAGTSDPAAHPASAGAGSSAGTGTLRGACWCS
jgi:hypothetical protein